MHMRMMAQQCVCVCVCEKRTTCAARSFWGVFCASSSRFDFGTRLKFCSALVTSEMWITRCTWIRTPGGRDWWRFGHFRRFLLFWVCCSNVNNLFEFVVKYYAVTYSHSHSLALFCTSKTRHMHRNTLLYHTHTHTHTHKRHTHTHTLTHTHTHTFNMFVMQRSLVTRSPA